MSIGIKVSKPGFDVKSTADLNLAFDAKFTHPQIFKAGKIVGTEDQFIHNLGFPPTTAGYILTDNKYFVQYDLSPIASFKFENVIYGSIRTDRNNVFLQSGLANRLIYIIFANPAQSIKQLKGGQKVRDSKAGMDLSVEGVDVKQAKESGISLSTHFETFNIVDEQELTINTPQLGPTVPRLDDTFIKDIPHNLGYAAHLLLINEYESGGLNYVPAAVGLGPVFELIATEVYIDSKKIRFRVSRTAIGHAVFGPATLPAQNFKFKYYLTNYRLPL